MNDQLRRIIPKVSEAQIEVFADPGRAGDDDRGTEGAEPFDGGYPAELSLSNPEAAETFRSLQNTLEYQAYRAYLDDFTTFLAGKVTLRHFRAHEFLAMGGSHSTPGAKCFGLNTLPPRELWSNVVKLTTVLDELRERLGAPISLNSVYRSQTYNSCVGGVPGSRHKRFDAADFVCHNGKGPANWAATARELRASGFFKGGMKAYGSFVHVDTRGVNVEWE